MQRVRRVDRIGYAVVRVHGISKHMRGYIRGLILAVFVLDHKALERLAVVGCMVLVFSRNLFFSWIA